MMKRNFFGIFSKIFFYTILILIFVFVVMFAFFSDQIKVAVELTQRQQISDIFQPLLNNLNGKSNDKIIAFAKEFHEKNSYYEFRFESADGQVLYQTKNFVMTENGLGPTPPNGIIINDKTLMQKGSNFFITGHIKERLQFVTLNTNGLKLYVSGNISGSTIYSNFIEKAAFAFILIFLTSLAAAAIFARRIAKPIQKIALDAKRMSDLEPVDPPGARRDEIGQLAGDVFKMYTKLKGAIKRLEEEIAKEREMEENQRYFFSAASHELKTPIAAASALLEGMLENVIEPPEYPKYLRECLKMMSEQNKHITEILEIVQLSNDSIILEKEVLDLKKVILEILPMYQTLADAKAQTIDVDIPDKLYFYADRKLFSRALSNIIMNAVQNTPEAGRIKLFTMESNTGSSVIRMGVLNKDVKINEEILPKLFQPFYREDKARSRGQGRSGLGLTIVQKALQKMEIPFALENIDEGVLFRMDLPSGL